MAPAPILVHLDESCLGNGRTGDNPGGAGGVIETRTASGIQRRDIYLSSPATTNNRMALAGAIATLKALSAKGRRLRVTIVSDSEYLVKGIRDWAPKWESLGWRRKGGAIENLELWRVLVDSARKHEVEWTWVRGHKGHPKNEYANDLAIKAATEQVTSAGAVESEFLAWLEKKRSRKLFLDYDPDAAFAVQESKLKSGERFKLAE